MIAPSTCRLYISWTEECHKKRVMFSRKEKQQRYRLVLVSLAFSPLDPRHSQTFLQHTLCPDTLSPIQTHAPSISNSTIGGGSKYLLVNGCHSAFISAWIYISEHLYNTWVCPGINCHLNWLSSNLSTHSRSKSLTAQSIPINSQAHFAVANFAWGG